MDDLARRKRKIGIGSSGGEKMGNGMEGYYSALRSSRRGGRSIFPSATEGIRRRDHHCLLMRRR
jgi:hypothetical protein